MLRVLENGIIECETADEALGVLRLRMQLRNGSDKPTGTRKRRRRRGGNPASARSWMRARREAKRQGRTDIAKVRSELAAKKVKAK